MTTTKTPEQIRAERRAHFSRDITTANGAATYKHSLPDPMLNVGTVGDAWAVYQETLDAARPLRADLQAAIHARADHMSDPDAVYTHEGGALVFSDPVGVKLQTEVRRIERELDRNAARSKAALADYLVEASIVSADAATREAFRERMIAAHAEVLEHADALVAAIRERERLWGLAGQPYFADDSRLDEKEAAWLPSLKGQRMAEVSTALGNLELALATIRPFRAAD